MSNENIFVLPEHQHRADLVDALVIFNKHNRFARGLMDPTELLNYNVDPSKVRFFSMEIEKFKKARVLGSSPVQIFLPKKRFAMDVRTNLHFPVHFFPIDTYGLREDDRKALLILVKIWRGVLRYSSQDVIPESVQKMLKFVTKWPLIIQQTGTLIAERGFIFNDEKGEFDYDMEAQPIYEILQIGWTEDQVNVYFEEIMAKKK